MEHIQRMIIIVVLLVLIVFFTDLLRKNKDKRAVKIILMFLRAASTLVVVVEFLSLLGIDLPGSDDNDRKTSGWYETENLNPPYDIAIPEEDPVTTQTIEPETTPHDAPGIEDMKGCYSGVLVPNDESWLPEYEYKVIRTKGGIRAYLRNDPILGDGHFSTVNEGTEVIVLARQDGASLVKVKEGVVGWVGSELLGDE